MVAIVVVVVVVVVVAVVVVVVDPDPQEDLESRSPNLRPYILLRVLYRNPH